MSYSDEPVLVTPARRWSVKVMAAILLVAIVVGGILYIPLYQHNLDAEARAAPRGPHHGALYRFTIDGVPRQIELGWIARAFSAVIWPAPAADTTLEISGDFGRETLVWDATQKGFGPGKLRLDPYGHHKVKLTLRQGDRILWTDTLWAYGVVETSGHGH